LEFWPVAIHVHSGQHHFFADPGHCGQQLSSDRRLRDCLRLQQAFSRSAGHHGFQSAGRRRWHQRQRSYVHDIHESGLLYSERTSRPRKANPRSQSARSWYSRCVVSLYPGSPRAERNFSSTLSGIQVRVPYDWPHRAVKRARALASFLFSMKTDSDFLRLLRRSGIGVGRFGPLNPHNGDLGGAARHFR